MEHAPYGTVNSWIRQPNLNPRHLIPALLRYEVARSVGREGTEGQVINYSLCVLILPGNMMSPLTRCHQNQAIRYLQYVTENLHNTDTAVHNYLLSLYISQARPNDEDGLLQFLNAHVGIREVFKDSHRLSTNQTTPLER